MEASLNITLNGEPKAVENGVTVSALLALLELKPRFLAVERNRELVPRGLHAECVLQDGDDLEIVTLVGGG
jgi:thiamine biosynthesis protein ThiS